MTSSDDMLDEAIEGADNGALETVPQKDVAQAAKKTASKAKHVTATVGDVLLYLKTEPVRKEALNMTHPPGFDQVLADPPFLNAVRNVMQIASHYKGGELPDPATLDQHLLQLAAWQTDLSMRVGYSEAAMNAAEGSFKLLQDRYLMRAKEYAVKESIHLTDALLKAAARESAEEMRTHLSRFAVLVHTFRSLYFANKQLIEVMDHAAARLSHERRNPHQEG